MSYRASKASRVYLLRHSEQREESRGAPTKQLICFEGVEEQLHKGLQFFVSTKNLA